MKHAMRATLLTIALLAVLPRAGAAADTRLFIRPWMELEPLVRIDAAHYPIPVEEAEKSLLELGRTLVSGMIYGWTFTYYPGDKARKVQESFQLSPVAQIPWGSPRLRVTETEIADRRLWARICYAMDDEEARRRSAWDSNVASLSTGRGTAPLQEGEAGKVTALEAAIKDAIRLSLDVRTVNKPRQIAGEVVLWDDPVTLIGSGVYTATVKIKVMVRELVPYRIF
jgi:hypothetical protein